MVNINIESTLSTPEKINEEETIVDPEREKKREMARLALKKATDLFIQQKIRAPYDMISDFGAKHSELRRFVLFHDISGSGLNPDENKGSLDDEDKPIEKFIIEELQKELDKY